MLDKMTFVKEMWGKDINENSTPWSVLLYKPYKGNYLLLSQASLRLPFYHKQHSNERQSLTRCVCLSFISPCFPKTRLLFGHLAGTLCA